MCTLRTGTVHSQILSPALKETITLEHLMSLQNVCVIAHQHMSYSLQALFECSVNLLQSFGLRLSGAAASLVS